MQMQTCAKATRHFIKNPDDCFTEIEGVLICHSTGKVGRNSPLSKEDENMEPDDVMGYLF